MITPAQRALRKVASPQIRKINSWFFKTERGQYGYGDQFLGVRVPEIRKIARDFHDLDFHELKSLLDSPIHEERSLSLIILCRQYERACQIQDVFAQKKLFQFYFQNKSRINNWDLVDLSAPVIPGPYIFQNPNQRSKIFDLIHSSSLWDRRIAVVSTFYFIRQGIFHPTLHLSRKLLDEKEDLLHKAAGWMLREVGKKDLGTLRKFLDRHAHQMPRTMLRYSIEKMNPSERKKYLTQGTRQKKS